MNFKKYLNIGVVVGSVITIERLIRKWDELFAESEDNSGWYAFGGALGAHWGNLINVLLWPLAIIGEISDFIQKD